MIRVLVVAASPVLRVGLSAMLTPNPKLTLIGSVPDLDSLEIESTESQPDVVLLDLSTDFQESVWEKLLYLQQQQYSSPFIVIADEIDNIDIETALRSGVQGILPEASTESEILAAVEAVAFGLVVLHPDVLEYLKESSLNRKVLTNPVQALTPREIEVLQMLGSGLVNKAIAKKLNISEHTVKFHISSIFQKLGVSTRTEAATVGVRLGLIML